MKRNFEFDHITVVRWGDEVIDLHNDYDLESFGTDLMGNEVGLSFTRNEYGIARGTLPSKVTIACTGDVRLAFNDLVAFAAPLSDQGIEIAYFNEDCEWLSFLDEDLARSREPRGLHVSFTNGFAVRIFCDEVTFAVQ